MKRKLYILMVMILMVGLFLFGVRQLQAKASQQEIDALNAQIEERKTKIKQLEANIEKYKANIEQIQLQASSLSNQLKIIANHMSSVQADIELTDEKIKKTNLEIESLALKISDKEKTIASQKKLVAKILRNINMEQEKNYLSVLLADQSLSEFFSEVQSLQTVYQDLSQTAKNLRLVKEEMESQKKVSENYKNQQQDLKARLALQKRDYEDQSNYKSNLLVQTKWNENTYQTMLNNLRQQYQATENEISAYEREVQKKLAQSDKLPTDNGSVSFAWPSPSHYITATFHDPEYPFRNIFEHSGLDIAMSQGAPLYAAASGYVAKAQHCSTASCYSYVLLVHTGNLSSLYGHMSSINVSADQYVNRGDLIGYAGGTPGMVGSGPFVTGPHLHFEIRLNGIPVDPLNYLP
ncbi:MAG: hypothetical protein COU31_00880 [Candidatus Magasanikbacteria bacterium CG10_big_fil_rev_8_21_14_0_10_40_10]|uniref:M23ase beta-sheet core domain-containing protein n=1 Tax=Candidatus Magasanikbacteria bacterium CG10_big_fil_rev_8_21_14_0_10_40_10 TaxID=1974648 RepID=A0A2M6W507_9BACT|nr:MAG: hypothetical protein COU31_00880 [Candidatus Magasanikbacteria bacterium CG10_big_fil_rev_8_21_14_0_10_40_10]